VEAGWLERTIVDSVVVVRSVRVTRKFEKKVREEVWFVCSFPDSYFALTQQISKPPIH
jgi:hypothetical protein